jgi:hypothetical protein
MAGYSARKRTCRELAVPQRPVEPAEQLLDTPCTCHNYVITHDDQLNDDVDMLRGFGALRMVVGGTFAGDGVWWV